VTGERQHGEQRVDEEKHLRGDDDALLREAVGDSRSGE
jgi:hypothetical protein